MTCAAALVITPGTTFEYAFRVTTGKPVNKQITAASKAASCVLTVPGHGLTDDWPFRIQDVVTPFELNSPADDSSQVLLANVVDADTLQLDGVNSLGMKAFIAGTGVISYLQPGDLEGLAARLVVRPKPASAASVVYSSVTGDLVVDKATAAIDVVLSAVKTAAIAWKSGTYDLELFDPADTAKVYRIASGTIALGA